VTERPSPGDESATTPLGSSTRVRGVTFAALMPGQKIANRYTIVAYLGGGGMGEVYEAEDHELSEHVALKIVRSDLAGDETTIQRFKREIQLARRVTHPNVCRIFDVSQHFMSGASITGDQDRMLFVSMELLRGHTLGDYLAMHGRFAPSAALPIVEQMCEGLSAAHRAGVIHRDFKSDNVMLIPSGDAPGGMRVVITDFGLARTTRESPAEREHLTTPGEVVGTPAYMAPEQVEGGEMTARSDIYALGVVMFEMMTGRLPFSGGTPMAVAAKRLTSAPPSPAQLVPKLDRLWDEVIVRCLQRNPASRFADAREIPNALRGGGSDSTAKTRWSRNAVQLLLLLAVSGTLAFFGLRHPDAQPRTDTPAPGSIPAAPSVRVRPSIAVLGFRNLTGSHESEWMSTAFSEMLTSELSAGEHLRCVPGENVARVRREIKAIDDGDLAGPTLAQIRSNLGSDFVVLGSYVAHAAQLRLDVHVQDTRSGETVETFSTVGKESELLQLVGAAGERLRRRLGAGSLTEGQATDVRASQPANAVAMRAYAEGLALLRSSRVAAAKPRLEEALEADPSFSMAHAAMAEALLSLGYEGEAKVEAKKAFDLAGTLGREERLVVEGRYYEVQKDWKKAIETRQALYRFFPDNLIYGLQLASSQTAGGDGKGALATLESLKKLPGELGQHPQIDVGEAIAADNISDYKRAIAAASRAYAKANRMGSASIAARAKLSEGASLKNAGQLQPSVAATRESARLYAIAGDRGGVARALSNLAVAAYVKGDLVQAHQLFEQALQTHREIGNKSAAARTILNLANVQMEEGDLAAATASEEECVKLSREIDDRKVLGVGLSNLAVMRQSAGDMSGARKAYDEGLAVAAQTGDQSATALNMNNLGDLQRLTGHLSEAREMYDQSLAIARKIGEDRMAAFNLMGLGDLAFAKGDLTAARARYQEALQAREKIEEKATAAETSISIANVALEEGNVTEAQTRATTALAMFREAKATDDIVTALEVLARTHIISGQIVRAKDTIDEAMSLGQKSINHLVRVPLLTTAALVAFQEGSDRVASARIREAVAEGVKARLVPHTMEARLVSARIEGKTDHAAAVTALTRLAGEAEQSGFLRISRNARAALNHL
jgi:serine/threonine protein kinase/tetratricopeptide (TPR) repeat protein